MPSQTLKREDWTALDWDKHNLREAHLQTWLLGKIKKLNAKNEQKIYTVKVMRGNKSGVPDLLFCINGKFVGMELKTLVGRISHQQDFHMKEIRDAGGIAGIVRCWDDAKTLIKQAGYSAPL